MSMKIMVTGKNRRIATDICKHLETDRDYKLVKCPASKSALLEISLKELPDVIIICTGDENSDSVKVFDVLKESVRLGAIEVIVVAGEDDRKYFMTNTELDRMLFMPRPVSLLALYKKLEKIEESLVERDRKLALTEFVNPGRKTFERKHILVVDDDPNQLIVIKDQLKEFYEVTAINGGRHIIRVLEKYKVDLILLDYFMPEMDGREVLDLLKDYPEYKNIPVVFLTGLSDKKAVIELLSEYKPAGYVLKPSKKPKLVAKIIEVLG